MSVELNKEELKNLLNIRNDQTIRSYLKQKLIPFELDSEGDMIFDRQQIFGILGLKQDAEEPLINSEEACKILGINDVKSLGAFLKSHKIPFYSLKNEKGMRRYFLRSELETSMRFTAKWDNNFPDYVARTHFLSETMKFVFNSSLVSSLTENEYKILDDIIFDRKTLEETGKKMGFTGERIRQIFQVACKKIYFGVHKLNKKIDDSINLEKENEKVKLENKMLLSKLKECDGDDEAIYNGSLNSHLIKIAKFDLSVRAHHYLSDMGIETLGQLTEMTREDIFKFRNIGKKTVEEIGQLLSQNGLSWKEKTIPIKQKSQSFEKTETITMQQKLQDDNKKLREKLGNLMSDKFRDNLDKLRNEGKIKELKDRVEKLTKKLIAR